MKYRLFKGVLITLASSGLFFLTNFLGSISLPSEDYGKFSAILNTTTLIGSLISFGINFYIISVGNKENLNSVLIFSYKFFIFSALFLFVCVYILNELSSSSAPDTLLYTYPASATIGLCMIITGYFQLTGNKILCAMISSIPNAIKSITFILIVTPTFLSFKQSYNYHLGVTLFLTLLFILTIFFILKFRKPLSSKSINHNGKLAAKFAFSNILVTLYTSMVVPAIFLNYGANDAAAFSVFLIFWSALNIITNHVFNNHYLIDVKHFLDKKSSLRYLFFKLNKIGALLGVLFLFSSFLIFKVLSLNLWGNYVSHEFLISILLITLVARSISAASGIFLSIGNWVIWKNIAQIIFIAILYSPLILDLDFSLFVNAYIVSEFFLMFFYFAFAYLRINKPLTRA